MVTQLSVRGPLRQIGWVTGPAPLVAAVGKAHQFVTFTVASSLQRAVAYGLDHEAVFYTCALWCTAPVTSQVFCELCSLVAPWHDAALGLRCPLPGSVGQGDSELERASACAVAACNMHSHEQLTCALYVHATARKPMHLQQSCTGAAWGARSGRSAWSRTSVIECNTRRRGLGKMLEVKRAYLERRLKEIGFRVLPAQGTYFMVADFRQPHRWMA